MTKPAAPTTRRLLAVDDNRLILRIIEDFFVPNGWEVVTADDVAAARTVLSAFDPDVIVSDVVMPGTDGWTFFEEVRKRGKTASVPFIFLTVESELPHRLRGLHLGADDYLTKPFEVEELLARAERLLEKSAAFKRAIGAEGDAMLAGQAAHLAISDLLQILSLNGKDGTVRLQRNPEDGRVEFVKGRIVDAQCGNARGPKALYRMLSWKDASFRVLPRVGEAPGPTIAAPTATLLMDGLVSLDEWSRWKPLLPEAAALLELADDTLRRLAQGGLKPAERDLIARSRGGIRVEDAIEASPFPDAEVAEAICTLLERGVFQGASGDRKVPTAPR